MAKVIVAVESSAKTAEQLERWIKTLLSKATPPSIAAYVVSKEE